MPQLPVDLTTGTDEHVGAQIIATQVKVIVKEAQKQLRKAQKNQKQYYDAQYCQ